MDSEPRIPRFGRANGLFLEAVSLLPNVAPVLVLLLAVMKFAPWLRGLSGVVVVHTLLNTALVSTAILRLFRTKVLGYADLAFVEGVSRSRFLFSVALPILASDLRMIFLFCLRDLFHVALGAAHDRRQSSYDA